MIIQQYKIILVLIASISSLALGYIWIDYLNEEDHNPTYKTIPEGPKIFNGKADKLNIEGLLRLSAHNDLSYISGSIENDQNYYSVVIDSSLLGKAGIKLHNNLYVKIHRVKISDQHKHSMVPNDFKIYEIVEVLD